MIRMGRKFIKPHLCPDCHRLALLVKHPSSKRCTCCHKRYRRHSMTDSSVKRCRRKYNNASYRRRQRNALDQQGYCALCGNTQHLSCHHTLNIRSGEWSGKHLTVLCERCHRIWETKVNKIRSNFERNDE